MDETVFGNRAQGYPVEARAERQRLEKIMPLHPQARAFLDDLAAQNAPGWHEMTPDEGRNVFAGLTDFFGQGPSVHQVEDRTVGTDLPRLKGT